MALPKVGILTEELVQQFLLRDALTHFGFEVVFNSSPSSLQKLPSIQPDAWVVSFSDEDEQNHEWFDEILSSDKPVLFGLEDRKSTRLNSSHVRISYAVFCLKTNKS